MIIEVTTTVTKFIDSVLHILTQYSGDVVNFITSAFISEKNVTINGVYFEEGDLCVIYEGINNVYINNDGDLIIDSDDAEQYSIDEQGNLIYTES